MSHIADMLRAFEKSDALGNGDFYLLHRAADLIEHNAEALRLTTTMLGFTEREVECLQVRLDMARAALLDISELTMSMFAKASDLAEAQKKIALRGMEESDGGAE